MSSRVTQAAMSAGYVRRDAGRVLVMNVVSCKVVRAVSVDSAWR